MEAKNFFHGPVNSDAANPQVKQEPLPDHWWAADFDDSGWANAKEFSVEEVDPKQPYYENDFEGAKFIWTDDLALDNTILFRTKIENPGWTQRWNTKPDLDVSGAPLTSRSGLVLPDASGHAGIEACLCGDAEHRPFGRAGDALQRGLFTGTGVLADADQFADRSQSGRASLDEGSSARVWASFDRGRKSKEHA